jgi:hypothetical protein
MGLPAFATGLPVTLSNSGDLSLAGTSGVDFPKNVGPVVTQDPRSAGSTGPNQYFARSAFSAQVLGTLGNANRRFFHGPGFNNWDFGLHKDTAIRENMNLQFRAEFFNMFNHAQFTNPNGNYARSRFGLVSTALPPRIGQLSLKLVW